jgi:hypothetical protein
MSIDEATIVGHRVATNPDEAQYALRIAVREASEVMTFTEIEDYVITFINRIRGKL